ncbi:SCP2 sterol-binding domain-containing protein [Chytriomyces cf. hyalinus JEL632]|nr:SCP2 sterol-binding domain-containing protein [Chytriomyces cf. hyalinus JEL632]
MSVNVEGYKSSALFAQIKASLETAAAKQDAIKKVKGVFHLVIKNAAGKETTWTIDLKNKGDVLLGADGKADITINLSDDTFIDLAEGKINGQKAFMSGKLKVKGNIALATKLDSVLKSAKPAAGAAAPAAPAAAPVAAPAAAAGSVAVSGFESSQLFVEIENGLKTSPKAQAEAAVKKVKAVFQFDVKNAAGTVQTWTLDLKNGTGSIVKGPGAKADVTIAVGDKDFVDMANGKLNGQKAFMSGKIKVKGQIMLATKLDAVLKDMRPKAKL